MNDNCRRILEVISEICISKSNRNIHPVHALDVDIYERVKIPAADVQAALNELIRMGRVEWGKTVNHNYFRRVPRPNQIEK